MAAVISLNNITLLLLFANLYIPCDQRNTLYATGYDDVLSDIELLIHTNADIDHILIGGDLNTDITRQRSTHTTSD